MQLSCVVSVLILFGACTKETLTQKNTSLIANKEWVRIAYDADLDQDGVFETDLYTGLMHECTKDDVLFFYENNVWEEREDELKCVETDPDVIREGDWTIDVSNTLILKQNNTIVSSVEIMELGSLKMITEFSDQNGHRFKVEYAAK